MSGGGPEQRGLGKEFQMSKYAIVCLSAFLHFLSLCLYFSLSVCLSAYLSVCLPFFTFCLSVCLSAYLSVCLCLSASYPVWVVSISWVLPSPPCSSVWVVAGGREAYFPRGCYSSPCSAESAHLYRKDDTARLCVFRLVSMTPVFNNNVTNDFYISATGHTVIVYTWNAQRASPSGVCAPWETLDPPLIGVQ